MDNEEIKTALTNLAYKVDGVIRQIKLIKRNTDDVEETERYARRAVKEADEVKREIDRIKAKF